MAKEHEGFRGLSAREQVSPQQKLRDGATHRDRTGCVLGVCPWPLCIALTSVDGGVASSSGLVLVLAVRNVEASLVLLHKTKINGVNPVTPLANTYQEVIGFDVTVNEVLGMDVFDARNLIQLLTTNKD
jgi:hypothetical protein